MLTLLHQLYLARQQNVQRQALKHRAHSQTYLSSQAGQHTSHSPQASSLTGRKPPQTKRHKKERRTKSWQAVHRP
eukprot:1118495-Rhodomonas_salina.1